MPDSLIRKARSVSLRAPVPAAACGGEAEGARAGREEAADTDEDGRPDADRGPAERRSERDGGRVIAET